jgi:hypothetical protein
VSEDIARALVETAVSCGVCAHARSRGAANHYHRARRALWKVSLVVSWLRPISSGRIRDRLKIVGDQLVFNFFLLQPRCFLAEARTKRSCGPDRIQLRSRLANIPGTDQPLTLTPPDSESPLAAESVPMPAAIAAALNRTRSGIPRSERRQLCTPTDLSRIAGNLRALPPVQMRACGLCRRLRSR